MNYPADIELQHRAF